LITRPRALRPNPARNNNVELVARETGPRPQAPGCECRACQREALLSEKTPKRSSGVDYVNAADARLQPKSRKSSKIFSRQKVTLTHGKARAER
jgi:hypothetical protein